MKEINLKEILHKVMYESDKPTIDARQIYTAMREACRQILELVAEKVSDSKLDLNYYNQNEQMQRKIRNTINQIK